MTFVTFPKVFNTVPFQSSPKVTSPQDLLSHHVSIGMSGIVPLIGFKKNPFSLFGIHAPQQITIKVSLIYNFTTGEVSQH